MQTNSSVGTHKSSIAFECRPVHVKRFLSQKAASQHIASTLRTGLTPWKDEIINDRNSGLPLCVANRESFSPINTLLLQIASCKNSFASRWWGTRSNWKELGGNIDESAEPTFVLDDYWTPLEVFCVDQVSGARADSYRVCDNSITTADNADYSLIEKLVEVSGADIRIGVGDANHSPLGDWYVPPNPWIAFPFHSTGDYILLQRPELRSSMASHYYTLLHEYVHWSEVRTNWISDLHERELVAEIGSGWMASELGCPPCRCPINHNKWLERWLWEIGRDETYVFRALDQARKAFQFIISIMSESDRC